MANFDADVVKSGKPTLLAFNSGKIITTEYKTLRKVRSLIAKKYPGVKFKRIVNITSAAHLKSRPMAIINVIGNHQD